MSFTDEDLKCLKEHIGEHFGDFNGNCQLTAEGLQSLVLRLETAEAALSIANSIIRDRFDQKVHQQIACAYADINQQWRKVAGK